MRDLQPLANLTQLERLLVAHSGVRDLTPLANWQALKYLNITDCPVCDVSPLAVMKEHGLVVVGCPVTADYIILRR